MNLKSYTTVEKTNVITMQSLKKVKIIVDALPNCKELREPIVTI